MTHQILTRLFVASLIILSEGAFVSEVNTHSDVVAASIDNTLQSLPAEFLDDLEAGSELVLTLPCLAPACLPLTDKVLDYSSFLAYYAIEYSPSNPRAPPVPV